MTSLRALSLSLVSLSLCACGSTTVAPADAATPDTPAVDAPTVDTPAPDVPVGDTPLPDIPTPDVQPVDVPPADVPPDDVPLVDAGVARATPSTECTVAPVALAETCGASASCPVVTHLAVRCSQQGFGASVAAGPDAVRVLAHTNVSGFVPRLLTVREGAAPAVQDLRFLPSASNALTVDDVGHTSLYAAEMPGVSRFRPGPDDTWSRETVRPSEPDRLLVLHAARERSDTSAAVLYTDLRDNAARLASLGPSGWSDRVAFTSGFTSAAVGLYPSPFLVYWLSGSPSDGMRALRLEGAGPTVNLLVESSNSDTGNAPRLVEGGLSGDETFPVVGVNTLGVMHVLVPEGGTFRDRVVEAAAALREDTDCPAMTGGPPGGFCDEVASCGFHRQGMVQSSDWAMARTADRRVWLAWVAVEQRGTARVTRRCGGPGCVCVREDLTTTGGSVVHLAEVTATGVVERFSGTVSATVGVGGPNVSMGATGNTLHLGMALGGTGGLDLRYLAMSTSGLR